MTSPTLLFHVILPSLFLLSYSTSLHSPCGPSTPCPSHLVCAGPSSYLRCVLPLPLASRCGHTPTAVCRAPLVCRSSKCQRPLSGLSEPCSPNKGLNCKSGLVCGGDAANKICVTPVRANGSCVGLNAVCGEGLECRRGVCKFPLAGMREKCADKVGLHCVEGLTCAGPPENRRCVKPMGLGGKCKGDPWWVCQHGLVCEDSGCMKKRRSMGERCEGKGERCAFGLLCAGTDKVKKCVKGMDVGGRCGNDPWWVCKEGLKCENGKCKLGMGARCEGREHGCEDHLVCAGSEKVKKCVKGMKEGGRCGNDPWWVCERDLICKDGKCKKVFLTEVTI